MFPLELCRILGSLQTDAPAHSYGFTKKSIESEFGQPIDKVFYYFEKKPIASGSIAQIHRALIDNRLVAVKVRHPNVETQIHMDFDIMSAIAKLIDSLPGMGWINLQESMAQFSKTIASQVRLDIEGASLTRFINNFQHWKDVDFPHPLFESESVLVESFLNGDNVSKMIHTIRQNPQKYELLSHFVVTKGEDIYLKMLIEDNLMHADLHPGNILLEISSKAGNHKITDKHIPNFEDTYFSISLVDAGMVARLTNSQKHNFIGLLEALGEGNAMEATDCIIQFSSSLKNKSFTKESVKYRALLDGMTELFSQRCKGYGTNVDIGEVLRGILNLVRIHQISIEANYATLVMNALCLDGLAKDMLPTYNVLDGAKQLLRLNRRCRRLPLPTALMQGLIKTFYPVAQNGKRRSDKKFLRLLRQQKDSLV